jgi:hypothetical protein
MPGSTVKPIPGRPSMRFQDGIGRNFRVDEGGRFGAQGRRSKGGNNCAGCICVFCHTTVADTSIEVVCHSVQRNSESSRNKRDRAVNSRLFGIRVRWRTSDPCPHLPTAVNNPTSSPSYSSRGRRSNRERHSALVPMQRQLPRRRKLRISWLSMPRFSGLAMQ